MNPYISIVTVNYNNLTGLQKSVESVFEERNFFNGIEYIVIDGMSSDGSAEYLQEHNSQIDCLVIEKDTGIFNAMNKGLRLATGDYVLFLNSGDYLVRGVISRVFEDSFYEEDILYGDTFFVDSNGSKIQYFHPKQLSFMFFLNHSINHQSTFIKRTLHQRFPYNERFKLASDWEFFLKRIIFENVKYKHLGVPICYYELDGLSADAENNTLLKQEKQIIINELEIERILEDYVFFCDLYQMGILKYFKREKIKGWRLFMLRKILSFLLR